MLVGSIEEGAGIFVIEELDENGNPNIIGQSLTMRQKGKNGQDRLTFDNIEISKEALKKLTSDEQAEILEIYKQAGRQALEKDQRFLGQLLKKGKITQEQYDRMILKEVVVGKGCNDLEGLKDLPEADVIVPEYAYFEYSGMGGEARHPWIDSAGGKAPTGSSGMPVLIAEMDAKTREKIEKELNEIEKTTNEKKNEPIPLWYGKVGKIRHKSKDKITSEDIKTIKEIEKTVYRDEQKILSDVEDVEGLEFAYGMGENMEIAIGSNQDWYMIFEEGEESLEIQDLAMVGGANSQKNTERSKENVMLATAEMSNYTYGLFLKMAQKGKTIECNATKDTSLVNIKRMVQKGLIEISDTSGRKIVYSKKMKNLMYEDETEVSYRPFSETSDYYDDYDDDYNDEQENEKSNNIEMLDLVITPNIEKMQAAYEESLKLLERMQDAQAMKGKEKEQGLDEKRAEIRDIE